MKKTGIARSSSATKASAKRQTVLPIAQKSCPPAHPKEQSVSSPSVLKSTGHDSNFPVQPSVPVTVPLPLSNSSVPAPLQNSAAEMDSSAVPVAVKSSDPQIDLNAVPAPVQNGASEM